MTFPTEAQSRVIACHSSSLFVQACPGSGKTRVVASRFLEHATNLSRRRGVALLSFTNAAADEIRKACVEGSLSRRIEFPHFVGTFDSFMTQFLVLPFEASDSGERLQIVDSWAKQGFPGIRLRGELSRHEITLDSLVFRDGQVTVDIKRIPRIATRRVVQAHLSTFEQRGRQLLRRLNRAGFVSCCDARQLALRRMQDPASGESLARTLSARFAELLVDEAQDCNDDDLQLIEWLRKAGIPVTVVCDPDQAIFEFRTHTSPGRLEAVLGGFTAVTLKENFRSSGAVCRCAASIRDEARAAPDMASGEHKNSTIPVFVVPYEGKPSSKIGSEFLTIISENSIAAGDAVAIAHKARVAAQSVGSSVDVASGSVARRLLDAAIAYQSATTSSADRLSALQLAEKVLILRLVPSRDIPKGNIERTAEKLGLERRWLRRAANGLLQRLDDPRTIDSAPEWVHQVREVLRGIRAPKGIAWARSPEQVLQVFSGALRHSESPLALKNETVHRVKGREFDAVMFVVPPDDAESHSSALIDNWRARNLRMEEGSRVAYVAITRARRLLAIALPADLARRLARIFSEREVPYVVRPLATTASADQRPLMLWTDVAL